MPSKLLNVLLFVVTVALDGFILFTVSTPWLRLTLGVALLVPIVLISSHLGLAEALAEMMVVPGRPRRFHALRKNVRALLVEIKRLNWLVVDRDRGFRDRESAAPDIENCQRGMEVLFKGILATAGKPDRVADEGVGPASRSESGGQVGGSSGDGQT